MNIKRKPYNCYIAGLSSYNTKVNKSIQVNTIFIYLFNNQKIPGMKMIMNAGVQPKPGALQLRSYQGKGEGEKEGFPTILFLIWIKYIFYEKKERKGRFGISCFSFNVQIFHSLTLGKKGGGKDLKLPMVNFLFTPNCPIHYMNKGYHWIFFIINPFLKNLKENNELELSFHFLNFQSSDQKSCSFPFLSIPLLY